jgi:hypothetical protein
VASLLVLFRLDRKTETTEQQPSCRERMSSRKISEAKRANKSSDAQRNFRSMFEWGYDDEADSAAAQREEVTVSTSQTIRVSVTPPSGRTLPLTLAHTATLKDLKEMLRAHGATSLPTCNMTLKLATNNFIDGAQCSEGAADATPLGSTGLMWRTTTYCDLSVSATKLRAKVICSSAGGGGKVTSAKKESRQGTSKNQHIR